jgi:hypothetical protein
MMARSWSAASSVDNGRHQISDGASGGSSSVARMIVGRLSADPAIGGPFGHDSLADQKGKTGYN